MNPLARIAVAAVAVVVVLGSAVYLFAPRSGVGGGPPATAAPSATPSAVPSASPSASSAALAPIDTTGWTTYTSSRYGFSIGHPADWPELPADRVYAFPADAAQCCPPPGSESFRTPADDVGVSAWSVEIKAGTSADAWIKAYCLVAESDSPCTALQGLTVVASMDGHAGRLVLFRGDTQAFILVGNRMYVVACWRSDSDRTVAPFGGARRLIEGYLSTMRLLPGGPAASATPHPS